VHSLGRGRDSVRRLRARLGDDAQRDALERLFIGDESLEGRLEAAYGSIEPDRTRAFSDAPARFLTDD
jgi:hypothetical protein